MKLNKNLFNLSILNQPIAEVPQQIKLDHVQYLSIGSA